MPLKPNNENENQEPLPTFPYNGATPGISDYVFLLLMMFVLFFLLLLLARGA